MTLGKWYHALKGLALQVTLMLPTKFRVSWPFGSGEEVKNRFSRWRPWWPSWSTDRNDFSYFWSTSHPNASTPTKFQVNWLLGLEEEAKNRFSIGTILAIFYLQVTPMFPTKFGVNWPFGWGEEVKNRFSRWWPSWISDQNDFSYFWSTSLPNASYQVLSQLAQGCRRSTLLKQLLMPHNGRHTTYIDWLQ